MHLGSANLFGASVLSEPLRLTSLNSTGYLWIGAIVGGAIACVAALLMLRLRKKDPKAPSTNPLEVETFWRAVFDGVESHLCVLDASGDIIDSNQAWQRFGAATYAAKETTIGGSFAKFCEAARAYGGDGPAELAAAARKTAAGISSGFSREYPALIGGEQRVVEVVIRPLPAGCVGAVLVSQRDRTDERDAKEQILAEKRKAETLAGALETSQQSLELAVKGGNLGLWHWDVTSGYFELSAKWLETLGHETVNCDASIDWLRERMHPDELVLWTAEDAASLASDEPYDRQFRLRRADGSYLWVQALGSSNALAADGSPESLSGILMDIDARKNAEMRDAELAKIIEESFNEVYIADIETGRFVHVNRGARENLGYSMDDLREMTPTDLKLSMTTDERERLLEPIIAGTAPKIEFEGVHKRRDGSTYPILLSLQRGRLNDRDVIVGVGADLTKRHELETQLAQAQKLESIGQMAAGIAHEMNTPLQFVSNNIKYLSDCSDSLFEVLDTFSRSLDVGLEPTEWESRYNEIRETLERTRFSHIRAELPEAIQDSLDGVDRVLHIIRAMKEFSHPGEQRKTPTDLNRALSSTATITKNRWKYAADLELDLDPTLPAVECEPGSLNQVFVNLIVNAADAVTERRERGDDLSEGRIVVRSRAEGDRVAIEVEDNGSGMAPDVLHRVFDPFFTTKEVGKGTGQGLALCHTIVTQKHGGSIAAKSEPDAGTVMRVTLPVVSPTTDAPQGPDVATTATEKDDSVAPA